MQLTIYKFPINETLRPPTLLLIPPVDHKLTDNVKKSVRNIQPQCPRLESMNRATYVDSHPAGLLIAFLAVIKILLSRLVCRSMSELAGPAGRSLLPMPSFV